MSNPAIQLSGVWRWFGESEVLRGLSLAVQPGEVYALLGRNGAGKTTAIRILLGMLEPHAGTAAVLGRDSATLSPQDRGRIGYVSEDHRLYPMMRVRDAVRFEQDTRPEFRRDVADRAIQRCALNPKSRILRLSRGQRAQLALILAVSASPDALIFDDPALGLDAVMRRELLDALIDLLSDTGCAVLFSSHHLQDVERMADHIGILQGGHLLVDAPLHELKERVQKCVVTSTNPAALQARQDWPDSVLASRPRRDGVDLTLLDHNENPTDWRAHLTPADTLMPDPMMTTPSLEELFLDLTADDRRGIFTDSSLEADSAINTETSR